MRLFLSGAAAAVLLFSNGAPLQAVSMGKKVPNFRLKDSKGKAYTLKSFTHPVMVFWYEGKNSKEQNRWIKKQPRH